MAIKQSNESKISLLIKTAKSLAGRPYKYGAKIGRTRPPRFFDCSLFTQYVFKQVGVNLPRSTILQAGEGKKVLSEDIKAGDLMFFHGSQGFYNKKFPEGIGHVVLYIGDGKTIHAASKRIREKPKVVERGVVEERSVNYVIKKYGPLIIIKRHV